jgi:predicted RNA binding protein YcfA (HicA-like mRNA interferase family)
LLYEVAAAKGRHSDKAVQALREPAHEPGAGDQLQGFRALLAAAGFERKRERGSHRSYRHPAVPELLTVQPNGKDAQPYQVRKFLDMMRRYRLDVED